MKQELLTPQYSSQMRTAKKNETKTRKPVPPEGWEIIDKDDPRAKKLPHVPKFAFRGCDGWTWRDSNYYKGDEIPKAEFMSSGQYYALPIAKKKVIKKVSKIDPPTPEKGWELVDKKDPRLKNLPCTPRAALRICGAWRWITSSYEKGQELPACVLRRVTQYYALPIAKIKEPEVKVSPSKPTKIAPPAPEGYEIVGKDDPRLDKLPEQPMFCSNFCNAWQDSGYIAGERVTRHDRNLHFYALPIAKIKEPEVKHSCSIRVRLPSEKPTRSDSNGIGHIYIRTSESSEWLKLRWNARMPEDTICWIPGRISDEELADLPKPLTQEDIWRAEGEKIWPEISGELLANNENGSKEVFLRGYIAAKKSK